MIEFYRLFFRLHIEVIAQLLRAFAESALNLGDQTELRCRLHQCAIPDFLIGIDLDQLAGALAFFIDADADGLVDHAQQHGDQIVAQPDALHIQPFVEIGILRFVLSKEIAGIDIAQAEDGLDITLARVVDVVEQIDAEQLGLDLRQVQINVGCITLDKIQSVLFLEFSDARQALAQVHGSMGLIGVGPEDLRELSTRNGMVFIFQQEVDHDPQKIRGYARDQLPAQTNSCLSKNRQLHSS